MILSSNCENTFFEIWCFSFYFLCFATSESPIFHISCYILDDLWPRTNNFLPNYSQTDPSPCQCPAEGHTRRNQVKLSPIWVLTFIKVPNFDISRVNIRFQETSDCGQRTLTGLDIILNCEVESGLFCDMKFARNFGKIIKKNKNF